MSDGTKKPLLMVLDRSPGLVNFVRSSGGEEEKEALKTAYTALAWGIGCALLGTVGARTLPALLAMGLSEALTAFIKDGGEEASKTETFSIGDMFLRAGAVECIGLTDVLSKDYVFSPGHPFPGLLYRLHPLADRRTDKRNVFVPLDEFDEVLLLEREAELVRVLTVLGASRIELHEHDRTERRSYAKLAVEAAGGGATAEGAHEDSDGEERSRVYELRGKPWSPDMAFERKQFGWLDFEPAWDSLVFARLHGGCTKATIELTKTTSFSLSGSVTAEGPGLKGELGGGHSRNLARSRLVSVSVPGPQAERTTRSNEYHD